MECYPWVTLGTRHNYIKFENNDVPELHSREKRSAENHHRSRRAFNPTLKECQLYMRVRLSGCNSISVFTVFSLISVPSFHAGHCRLSTVSLTIFFLSILLFLKHFQPPQRQPPSSKAILGNNKTMSNFELIVNSYYYIFFFLI